MKYKIKITNSEYINKLIQEKLFELGFKLLENPLNSIKNSVYIAIDSEYQHYTIAPKKKIFHYTDYVDYQEITIDKLMKLTPEDFKKKEYIQVEKEDLEKLVEIVDNHHHYIDNIKRKYNL